MVGIPEYLLLRNIEMYLETRIELELEDNNGFSNMSIKTLKKMKNDLTKFLNKISGNKVGE